MKITTKKGDKGYTTLLNGKTVPKSSEIIKLLSSLDKLVSYLGICKTNSHAKEIELLQYDLYKIMGTICTENDINNEYVSKLEERMKPFEDSLPNINHFLIPTGESARLHFARSLARETETQININHYPNLISYINRLSDYLFLLAYKVSIEKNEIAEFK